MTSDQNATHWLSSAVDNNDTPMALCLGTGRFLRSVLVPALVGAGLSKPVLIQTRGRSFLEYMQQRPDDTYEVDTVQPDGSIVTEHVPCGGAFSLGNDKDKAATLEWIAQQTNK
jgi:hypothetical protein